MIASIRGRIFRINLNSVHIETSSGLGYEVFIPFPVHLQLKNRNRDEEVFLFVHQSVSERGEKLFGFLTHRDKELFLLIKSLNGIGELTALKILSFFDGTALHRMAVEGNKELLEKIPKIRGKTSEKILFELKQNLKKIESFLLPENQTSERKEFSSVVGPTEEKSNTQKELAILGLVQLGFDEKSARKEAEGLWNENIREASEIIRIILSRL